MGGDWRGRRHLRPDAAGSPAPPPPPVPLRSVLEHVRLADIASGKLPKPIARLASDPDAWAVH